MTDLPTDRRFAGSIPQLYERHLVPLIFAPYAHDLAARTARSEPGEVLELAAGTGVLTRELARALPAGEQVVVHGGVSVEELIVPFVKVSYVIGTE